MPERRFTASRCLALLGLGLKVWQFRGSLPHIGGEVRHLLHLANLDDFVRRPGTALGPFDRFFFRVHLIIQ